MKCGEKVIYLNRPAWIVGARPPSAYNRSESGRHYDLCRKPNCPRVDFPSVPEKHIRPYIEEITPVSCNGSVQFVSHPVLVKA